MSQRAIRAALPTQYPGSLTAVPSEDKCPFRPGGRRGFVMSDNFCSVNLAVIGVR